jgi:hypothetical protein
MRVYCHHCGEKATIQSSNQITRDVKDLYARCNNIECGALTVIKLGYSHTIHHPINDVTALAMDIVKNLTDHQKRQLVQGDLLG